MTSVWVPPGVAFIATGIRQDHDISVGTTRSDASQSGQCGISVGTTWSGVITGQDPDINKNNIFNRK